MLIFLVFSVFKTRDEYIRKAVFTVSFFCLIFCSIGDNKLLQHAALFAEMIDSYNPEIKLQVSYSILWKYVSSCFFKDIIIILEAPRADG